RTRDSRQQFRPRVLVHLRRAHRRRCSLDLRSHRQCNEVDRLTCRTKNRRESSRPMISTIADKLARYVSPAQTAWLFDKTPPSALKSLTRQRFRRTVQWAATHSAFYKRAFAERGIDPARV